MKIEQYFARERFANTRRRVKRLLYSQVALVLVLAVALGGVFQQKGFAQAAQSQDASWILGAQLSDGAIALYQNKTNIEPYFANIAATGLARATQDTGNTKYAAASWSWLKWYAAHMDSHGYVTDYNIANGHETSTGNMDSTDSYAATFITATAATYLATGNRTQLSSLHSAITKAVGAIESTQDNDGLTWAKPSYHVKYLMDAAEVWQGLNAASNLGQTLKDSSLSSRAFNDAVKLSSAVAGLWDPGNYSYDWAKDAAGVKSPCDWRTMYPDIAAQGWAVAYGLVADPARAADLMSRTNAAIQQWDQPGFAGYWPVLGSAFVQVGNRTLAVQAYQSMENYANQTSRVYPLNVATAGELLSLNHSL